MIPSVIFYILGTLIYSLAIFLPEFSIYPTAITEGLAYVGAAAGKLNFIFAMTDLFNAFVLIFQFLGFYYSAKIIISIVNWFRGAGSIEM